VDAGAGVVKTLAHKGIIGRNVITQLPLEILSNLADHRGVDAVGDAPQRDILDEHALDGGVAGAFPETQERPVHRAAAIEPGGDAVDQDLVEIIVAVPLQEMARHPGVVDHGPHQLGHTPGQGGAGIRHAVAHGVAQPHLDIDAAFGPQLHQLDGEGHAKAVDVGPGDVLEVAPGNDALLQGGLDDAQVFIHGLFPAPVQLQEDVVI
jgi:hypothetical protein